VELIDDKKPKVENLVILSDTFPLTHEDLTEYQSTKNILIGFENRCIVVKEYDLDTANGSRILSNFN
jgi:hypothetical protein